MEPHMIIAALRGGIFILGVTLITAAVSVYVIVLLSAYNAVVLSGDADLFAHLLHRTVDTVASIIGVNNDDQLTFGTINGQPYDIRWSQSAQKAFSLVIMIMLARALVWIPMTFLNKLVEAGIALIRFALEDSGKSDKN